MKIMRREVIEKIEKREQRIDRIDFFKYGEEKQAVDYYCM